MSAVESVRGDEPPMFLQRPTSARSQDVSHVLTRTFREFFTREAVPPDTVQYLTTSRGGDDPYHEGYVQALKEVQDERERRLVEAAMLERHIMQAQARAMSADEKELNRVSSATTSFPDLGLPPVRSYFRSCIDAALMKKHNLITPEDFATQMPLQVPPPSAPDVPNYARDTISSSKRQAEDLWESPFPSTRGSMDSDQLPSRSGSSFSIDEPLPPIGDQGGENRLSQAWKEQISAETREENRIELANLQAKVDFLKNPRHVPPSALGGNKSLIKPHKRRPKEIGIKPMPDKKGPSEPSVVFVASPSVITFSEYSVGQVYEIALELKNVTSVMRPVRVIPPKTEYFSVGLGQFPGEQGLVAPGMSCRYMIRFSPDSLSDYDDTLCVQTQSSSPLVVDIRGRRPPPQLTVPSNMHIGQCLTGGVKIGHFHVKNEGGTGRFCLLPKSQWPTVNFKSLASLGRVILPPFEVRPPVFELRSGQTMVLEVLFTPQEVKQYQETLTVVCDNCHVKHLTITGEGQTVGVELVSVDGGLDCPNPGELHDISAQHLVKFENLNPYTYLQKSVLVKNLTNVELPYDWITVKPYIKPLIPGSDTSPDLPTERVQSLDTVFNIEPDNGTLAAGGLSKFTLTFAPPAVNDFHDAFHLVLRNIPKVSPPVEPPSKQPTQLELRRSESMHTPTPEQSRKAGEMVVEDVTGLEMEVKGTCEPLSVIIQPYAITVPGQTMVETLIKRQFKLFNNSLAAVLFQWENHSGSFILEVEPPIGEVGPQCEVDLELSISASEPCKIGHTLNCFVHHLEEPLTLHVQADIKGPEITIEDADVNFGLVRLGEAATTTVTMTNSCRVPAKWSIRESSVHQNTQENILTESEFSFSPALGELGSLETVVVTVTYFPRLCKSLRSVFEVHVEDGSDRSILVRGEVQNPQVCLLSCEVTLEDVYLNVPITHQVSLLNQTLLATTYEWGELEGADADSCTVNVEPASGAISPRQQLDVTLHFTAHSTGFLSDLMLPVTVGGMSKPLYLSLSSDVNGLSVSYRIQDGASAESDVPLEDTTELCLDMGSGVALGQTVTRHLYIRNHSAITAPFSLNVEYFIARPPTPPDSKPGSLLSSKTGARRGLLSKTQNLADPQSKTPARAHTDLCKAMLREGKGAAFAVTPPSGHLPPFSEQRVDVVSYCDMWGEYTDSLVCQVEELDPVVIPIRLSVVGCPLHFQMVAAQPLQQPILRYGTHVSGVTPVLRQMRINNPCPCDVRLDWQVFNKEERSTQLLDMILAYDQAFPLLDAQGQEVIPADDDLPSLPRQPTDLIPNTPGSTPAPSRELTMSDAQTPVPLADRRPTIIHVTLREHGGKMSTSPYNVIPSQVIVPGRGNCCISLSFTPPDSCDVTHETDCDGFALGYMGLTDQSAAVEGKVQRSVGYDVNSLRLEMTAKVKPALLTVECDDDEGLRYRAAASDLLDNGQIVPQCLKLCRMTLINNTLTSLKFRLVSAEPFQIVQLDGATRKPIAQLLQTEMTSLRPRENAMVQVGFQLTRDLLDSYEDSELDGVEVEERGSERRIHFRHDLLLEFNNNSTQRVPLYASLVMPRLDLSKDTLDFGTCFVGQQRELQLILSNTTMSASLWTCTQETRSENSVANTFCVTPNKGYLNAHVTHVSDSRTLIRVHFTAKHSEAYEAVYVIQGVLGEEPRRLHIRGEGSYDGKHEALVNV